MFISVVFDGGNILMKMTVDVALPSFFLKIWIFDVDFGLAGHFLTPSRVGSIGKSWSNEADTAIDR